MKSLFLKNIAVHTDWEGFLTKEIRNSLTEIEKQVVNTDFTPAPDKVLRFLTVPLSSVRIIILGQDPYPQKGVATGRAFEVGGLRSWSEPFNNVSLKNILRAIYKAYTGDVIKYNELKAKFDNEFPVLPPGKLFSAWEGQGVLLLNSSFTCAIGSPGSHSPAWKDFTGKLIPWINHFNEKIVWFLWGAHAQSITSFADLENTVKTMHPMMCAEQPGRETDFLFGKVNCFERYKNEVNWTGHQITKVARNPKLF